MTRSNKCVMVPACLVNITETLLFCIVSIDAHSLVCVYNVCLFFSVLLCVDDDAVLVYHLVTQIVCQCLSFFHGWLICCCPM